MWTKEHRELFYMSESFESVSKQYTFIIEDKVTREFIVKVDANSPEEARDIAIDTYNDELWCDEEKGVILECDITKVEVDDVL